MNSLGSSFPEDGSEESSGECGNSEFYESEFWESETGEGWESESKTSDVGSLYIPTPERPSVMGSPIDLPNVLGFIELPQLGKFLEVVNKIRSCTTPGCKGHLAPVGVKCQGLGGGLAVSYSCDGCTLKGAMFETHSANLQQLGNTNALSMCVQVAFIIAGSTHARYYKTLKHALGIQAVSAPVFMNTLHALHPVVESMLDKICEDAKQEMRDKKEDELGSWKKAVTVADGTWQTRGWHSKNATFTIRNYLNGALLYYHHLCQKGRDEVIKEELYKGTSKSSEGYAARATFHRAKEEGMQVAVHWQDGDSSSANALTEVFPNAEVMICGGHAGRAHKKILELRQKIKNAPKQMVNKYKNSYPALGELTCKCKGNHSDACGCLTPAFITKAHKNFSSILMEAQSPEEFVNRLEALPKHERDEHVWEGGRCNFHPLLVCTCKSCDNAEQIKCKGEPYKTRMKLDCAFHALLYEIECMERAKMATKLVHPILKRGHSNAVESSHNVLIRFRCKDISIERLHYHVSTNLGLLQANLTYMHGKLGTNYHWIPELYQRMKLPIFEGVAGALEKHSVERKRALEVAKTTPAKKRRVYLKKKRAREGIERIKWSKKHGRDTYFGGDNNKGDSDSEHGGECGSGDVVGQPKGKGRKSDRGKGKSQGKGKCAACGSSSHQRSSHKECPFNKTSNKKGCQSDSATRVLGHFSEEGSHDNLSDLGDSLSDSFGREESMVNMCICGAERRGHKRTCPLSSRSARTLFPRSSSSGAAALPSTLEPDGASNDSPNPPPSKEMKVGDHVCVHSKFMGSFHLPCRIVGKFGGRYQLYCTKGVLITSFCATELTPLATGSGISLENWRTAPKIKLRNAADDTTLIECSNCDVPSSFDIAMISSASEGESEAPETWVNNGAYILSRSDKDIILSPRGWLTDKIISAAQMLLLQFYPNMAGLQPPVLQKVHEFEVHCGEFIQIVHVGNNHWCVVSTVGYESGVIRVYDSLYKNLKDDLVHLIASMVYRPLSELKIVMMDVEKQSNISDCGILAIAYAFDICSGLNPCVVKFDHSKIRQHLATCLENCQFSRFPTVGERNSVSRKPKTVKLYCSCRMPEKQEKGLEMAMCDSCHMWYHRHCMDIPSEVFDGDSEVHWECKSCAL